jgi:hypothetical protein
LVGFSNRLLAGRIACTLVFMPAKESRQNDMHALRNLIDEAHTVLSTVDLPQGRAKRATKLLESALALTDDLIALPPAAVTLGQRGGLKTAERGSEYFRKIAAKRKTRAGRIPKANGATAPPRSFQRR